MMHMGKTSLKFRNEIMVSECLIPLRSETFGRAQAI